MKCTFCQKECRYVTPFDEESAQISEWHECNPCKVAYRTYCRNGRIEMTRFYADFRDRTYCIDLDVTTHQTEILLLPKLVDDTIVIVMILPYVIEGITPANIQSKLETYVTFS